MDTDEALTDREIDWVRHQLDSLTMVRTGGGFSAADADQYERLCGMEANLIAESDVSTACREHDHGACLPTPIPTCACWCHWGRSDALRRTIPAGPWAA